MKNSLKFTLYDKTTIIHYRSIFDGRTLCGEPIETENYFGNNNPVIKITYCKCTATCKDCLGQVELVKLIIGNENQSKNL